MVEGACLFHDWREKFRSPTFRHTRHCRFFNRMCCHCQDESSPFLAQIFLPHHGDLFTAQFLLINFPKQEAGHHHISASWALVTRVQVGRGNHDSTRRLMNRTESVIGLAILFQ